jgi:hypothetical protein
MPLRGRVGRHADTGRQCQNWKEDQDAVIALLNRIPIVDGGSEGMLGTAIKMPVVTPGIASEELCKAIVLFQKKQFGTVTGFIDTVGRDLPRLEYLASRPTAPVPRDGQWDDLKSGSVEKSLRKGLEDDRRLSHAAVVDMIRNTLVNDVLSDDELDDLETIAAKSRSISPRSKALLEAFTWQVRGPKPAKPEDRRGPYRLTWKTDQVAADRVFDFLKRSSGTYFPGLNRELVGVGLLLRVFNPGLIRQGAASLCGPAALLFNIAVNSRVQYAQFAIDLFEKGKALLYRLLIEPGKDIRNHTPSGIAQVDWLTLASIRDSENWFLDYDTEKKELAGTTMPGELAQWFRMAGFSDVQDETNLYANKGNGTIDDANELLGKGYRVVLLINFEMLDKDDQTKSGSVLDRHWVVLRSPIDRSGGNVTATVYSWGNGSYKIPQGAPLSVDDFLDNFYGFVAAKP